MKKKADVGLIGLAVMGQNLVLNLADHGHLVAVYNRTTAKTKEFCATQAKGKEIIGSETIEEFVSSLQTPRVIMMMVKAGEAVDALISQLLPHLSKGDILIDGGNSHYPDTNRRCADLEGRGILYVGAGISGGEVGARFGPSIMPGGNEKAWKRIGPILQAIAAKADDGTPCCDWVGDAGAGHYVKMVHNGIEYGDMQLICEIYDLLRRGYGLDPEKLADLFHTWNEGELNSYLIEITSEILRHRDEDGSFLVDNILDSAGQKGTGKWTAIDALSLGTPLTLIAEAVFARCLSAQKDERIEASQILPGPSAEATKDESLVADAARALYAAKMISYAQGFSLLRTASQEFGWKINYGSVAMMWRGGCIIRSKFLNKISDAYDRSPNLPSLMLDPFFASTLKDSHNALRHVLTHAIQRGIPTPSLSAALNYYDGYRTKRLPANLLQAQRDYFGAHTYERLDAPRGKFFHTDWAHTGGRAHASTYSV